MAGLAPPSLRLDQPRDPAANDTEVIVDVSDGDAVPQFDDSGAILRIENGDGSLTISTDGRPLQEAENEGRRGDWFDNLVYDIDPMELGRISNDLMRGIEDDITSRREWVDSIAQGINLLGLKIEIPGLQGATDGAPVEGMSKVRHPLLLEAVLRFQANARSELLPTDGPVKVRDDGTQFTTEQDDLGDRLEKDLNHYLTAIATEYYPDTDRMLLKLGFAGTSFKKVYFCPLRMRPVSETVDANDLIVNNQATDLANAKRITHKLTMRPSTVRRMQILGIYRDIPLMSPKPVDVNAATQAEKSQQGVSVTVDNPEDRDREIYECYCELDVKGFEHRYKGKESGLEIPYRVTIDVTSREILSIVRNYDEPDPEDERLPEARKTFVKYTFVPGLGFYDIGLLHILGNTTNAITAAWREMLDNGMYANFPGFMISDVANRQNTNLMRVPPGGGQVVKAGGQDIRQVIMPLPYNTAQMPSLMALVGDMAQTGMRIGGTSELQVGEGRADAPVGTTLAMIEQATKVLNSVHKRLHASQAEEFKLLVECFREHPDSFCQKCSDWSEQSFLQALDDNELVPQADPNTASHSQRLLKVQGLVIWAQMNPELAEPIAIAKTVLRTMGWSNPGDFMLPADAMKQPPPELLEAQAKMQAENTKAQAAMVTAQARMQDAKNKGLAGAQQPPNPLEIMQAKTDAMDAQTRSADSQTKRQELALRAREAQIEDANRDQDRQSREHEAMLGIAKDILTHPDLNPEVAARQANEVNKDVGP